MDGGGGHPGVPTSPGPGCFLSAPPYLQEVGDAPCRAGVPVHCTDPGETAPRRCVLRGRSHRGSVPGAVTGAQGAGVWGHGKVGSGE